MSEYHINQACELLETGKCQLPVDWADLSRRVAAHPSFGHAMQKAYKGDNRLLKLLTENAAVALCKDFDNAA